MNENITKLTLGLYFFTEYNFTEQDIISGENLIFCRLQKNTIFVCNIFRFVFHYKMLLYNRFCQFFFEYHEKSKSGVEFIIIHTTATNAKTREQKEAIELHLKIDYKSIKIQLHKLITKKVWKHDKSLWRKTIFLLKLFANKHALIQCIDTIPIDYNLLYFGLLSLECKFLYIYREKGKMHRIHIVCENI